jgi:Fe-S cluster assembly protein SufD
MAEIPRIISRGRRSEESHRQDFQFSQDMLPLENLSPALQEYRLQAWETFKDMPMPTVKDDSWRRTDLSRFNPGQFSLAQKTVGCTEPVPNEYLHPLTAETQGGQIILQTGHVSVRLLAEIKAQGVVLTDLRTAEREYPHLLEKISGKIVSMKEGKFAALVSAFSNTGVFLYVPAGVRVDKPLQSLLWGCGENLAYLSHILVYLEEGSSATFVHESASPTETEADSLHAGITEIYVGSGAELCFVELQSWGQNIWNFSHERARIDQNGKMDWIFGAIGSKTTKNFTEIDLVGQGSTGKMSGFYFTNRHQHLDHDTQQNHLARNTTSDLLFKGALLDESHSVWQGMIYVAAGAAKTDGYQANRNLILSDKAHADSIPGLEIMADDVRCTHAVTVGRIDADQVFYLLSRGIPRKEAEQLIVEGFFDPIMQRIPFEGVRGRFQHSIHEKMQSYTASSM